MITASRRTASLFAVLLAVLTVALALLAAPANATVSGSKMQNQEQPWFSGPVCLEIDQTVNNSVRGPDYGYGQVEWCSYDSQQQYWTAVSVKDNPGFYELKNTATDRCLAVKDGLFADGTRTIQSGCSNGQYVPSQSQQWSFVFAGNSSGKSFYEVIARHSSKCLTNSGWNALQYNCNGAANQHWTRPF